MYSKHETHKSKQEFWTAFGKYMQPVLSSEGIKINWVNYKTGIKDIRFAMDVNNQSAFIGIIITGKNEAVRQEYYHHFERLKKVLENEIGENLNWQKSFVNEFGMPESLISTQIEGVSIMQKSDWPAIISFFKPRIISLDAFWSLAKVSFEDLIF